MQKSVPECLTSLEAEDHTVPRSSAKNRKLRLKSKRARRSELSQNLVLTLVMSMAASSRITRRITRLKQSQTRFLNTYGEFAALRRPPRSPDLTPREHLWGRFESWMCRVCDAIMSAWSKASEECFQRVVESVPWRSEAVLKAKGVQPSPCKVGLIRWTMSVQHESASCGSAVLRGALIVSLLIIFTLVLPWLY